MLFSLHRIMNIKDVHICIILILNENDLIDMETEIYFAVMECFFGIESHVAIDRNPWQG